MRNSRIRDGAHAGSTGHIDVGVPRPCAACGCASGGERGATQYDGVVVEFVEEACEGCEGVEGGEG